MIIVLVVLAALVTFIIWKLFGSIFVPTTYIFFPITGAVLLLCLVGPSLDFYSLEMTELWSVIIGLIAITCGEVLVLLIMARKERRHSTILGISTHKIIKQWRSLNLDIRLVQVIVAICLSLGFIRLIFLMASVGIARFFDTDGLDGALLTGPCARVILIGYALCPLLLKDFFEVRSWKSIILWILYIILIFMTMVKYHPIVLILASLIYSCLTGAVKVKKALPLLVVIPVMLFYLSYVIIFASRGDTARTGYLERHLVNYLSSGVLYSSLVANISFGQYLSPFYLLLSQFMPIPNMVSRAFTGANFFEMPATPFVSLGANGERGNVCNLVSMFFLNKEWIAGFVALLIIGMICAFLTVNPKNSLLACYVVACLILSFFGDYFALSPIWETFIYTLIIPIFIKYIEKWIKADEHP